MRENEEGKREKMEVGEKGTKRGSGKREREGGREKRKKKEIEQE